MRTGRPWFRQGKQPGDREWGKQDRAGGEGILTSGAAEEGRQEEPQRLCSGGTGVGKGKKGHRPWSVWRGEGPS